MLGKLLALPVRILNVSFRTLEKIVGKAGGGDDIPKEDRIVSKPLEALAEAIEDIDSDSK